MATILRINNNIPAINALRHLNETSFNLNKTLQRLASGLRIVTAADDPAGLIISEQLRSQIASLKAASRNVSEADKYMSIAEGALDEVNRLLVEMRALALHGANDATSADQRAADAEAFGQAALSIQRIITQTRYAGDTVFPTGGGLTKTYRIGDKTTDTVSVAFPDLPADANLALLVAIAGAPWANAAAAVTSVTNVDNFSATISNLRGELGAVQKYTFQARERTLAIQIENVAAAESNIRDANMAEETTNFTKYQILTQAGIAVLAQANVVSQNVLQLLG